MKRKNSITATRHESASTKAVTRSSVFAWGRMLKAVTVVRNGMTTWATGPHGNHMAPADARQFAEVEMLTFVAPFWLAGHDAHGPVPWRIHRAVGVEHHEPVDRLDARGPQCRACLVARLRGIRRTGRRPLGRLADDGTGVAVPPGVVLVPRRRR